jgi:4-hydroxyphenylacetate 3-monooxygenase
MLEGEERHMPARTGHDYLGRLNASTPTVFVDGDVVRGGISSHPAFRGITATYASLYDLQHDPTLRDVMTFESPSSGDRVGMSFLAPKTAEDLVRRRTMNKVWADRSLGMLGRTGDYLNCCLMALSEAAPWFAQADPAFARHIQAFTEYVRENDLLLTHTLIAPQANRAQSAARQQGGNLTARIVREDDSGVVLRGARMLATIGPIADELLVFPSTVLRGAGDDAAYAFALAVKCDTPGLRFICREPLAYQATETSSALGARFDEMDAVVVFDDVHVPYERCFMLGHPDRCNGMYTETSAAVHMTHQVVTRTASKTEAVLGVVSLLSEGVGIDQFQHVQEDIAEIIVMLEIVRGLTRAAEADAQLNRFGVLTPRMEPLNACRNWYPRVSQRLPAILRKLGASGLMALPAESDLLGPAEEDIRRYLQSATLDGAARVRLFRLAWDMCISTFGGRQALYEYFFFGDPVRMSTALVSGYDRAPYMDRIREFLDPPGRSVDEAG